MKTVMVISLVCFLGCQSENRTENTPTKAPILVCLLWDISASTKTYYKLQPHHLDSLYQRIAANGGVFYGMLITANSNQQVPISADIPATHLLPAESSNPVGREKIRAANANHLLHVQQEKLRFQATVAPWFQLKQVPYTDISAALQMAKLVLDDPRYAAYQRKLLVVSDFIQHIHGRGYVPVQAISLPADVLLVRPAGNVKMEEVFGNRVRKYVTVEDAIKTI